MHAVEMAFRIVGALAISAFIGMIVAATIQAVEHRQSMPQWPIWLFVVVGGAFSAGRLSAGAPCDTSDRLVTAEVERLS
jgi:hypothetical protein